MTWLLNRPAFQVQLEAMRRSEGHAKYAYFAEMGCGKSGMALNSWRDHFPNISTVVVVCPATFRTEWASLPAEWGVEHMPVSVWPKPMRRGTFCVINYESIRASGYEPIKTLFDRNDCLFVVDESSAIKNPRSKQSRAVVDLSKRAKAVRLLNGTPMSQNVLDLFPQLKCLGQLDRMNLYQFKAIYAITGGYMGKQVIGIKNETELHKILDRCSFRALKKDWLDLPEKIYTPVRLEMTSRQRKHYKELMDEFITMVEGHEYSAAMVLNQCEKVRQVASGLLIDGDKHVLLEEPQNNPKLKATLDIIAGGPSKVVVVYLYSKMGEVLLDTFTKHGLRPAYLRGSMKAEEIIEQKSRFNSDSSCRVMVAQISASRFGHTLLGGPNNDRCSRMVFFDHTFNMLDRLQMEDRIHRGVQDQACQYFDLILSKIDEVQLKALAKKQSLAEAVVDAVRSLRAPPIRPAV